MIRNGRKLTIVLTQNNETEETITVDKTEDPVAKKNKSQEISDEPNGEIKEPEEEKSEENEIESRKTEKGKSTEKLYFGAPTTPTTLPTKRPKTAKQLERKAEIKRRNYSQVYPLPIMRSIVVYAVVFADFHLSISRILGQNFFFYFWCQMRRILGLQIKCRENYKI